MFNRYLTYYAAPTQFVIFCALLSMGFLMGGYFFDLASHKALGISGAEVQSLPEITTQAAITLRWILPLTNLIILFLPAVVFAYLAYPKPARYLGLHKPNTFMFLLLAILWFISALPFSNWLEGFNSELKWVAQFEKSNTHLDQLANALLGLHGSYDLLWNLIFIAFLPALVEEVFFRGCLQQLLLHWMKKHDMLAILLVAFIFSAFHMQMSAFLPRFFLGILLGFTYHFSGNLWNAIVVHFLNNALIVVLYYLYKRGLLPFDILHLPSLSFVWALCSLPLVLLIGFWFYKQRVPPERYILTDDLESKNEINER